MVLFYRSDYSEGRSSLRVIIPLCLRDDSCMSDEQIPSISTFSSSAITLNSSELTKMLLQSR